jgi:hypothetical protein
MREDHTLKQPGVEELMPILWARGTLSPIRIVDTPAARQSAGHLLLAGGPGPARRLLPAGRRIDASLLRPLATAAHLRWLRRRLQAGEHPLRSDQQGARRAPKQAERTRRPRPRRLPRPTEARWGCGGEVGCLMEAPHSSHPVDALL